MRYDLNSDGIADDKGDLADLAAATAAYKALFPGLLSTNYYTGYRLMQIILTLMYNASYSNAATNKPKWTPDESGNTRPIRDGIR